jgi:hypothetical protein
VKINEKKHNIYLYDILYSDGDKEFEIEEMKIRKTRSEIITNKNLSTNNNPVLNNIFDVAIDYNNISSKNNGNNNNNTKNDNSNNRKPNQLLSNRNLQPIQKPIEVSGVDESVKQKLNSRFSELNNNTQDFDYSDFDF